LLFFLWFLWSQSLKKKKKILSPSSSLPSCDPNCVVQKWSKRRVFSLKNRLWLSVWDHWEAYLCKCGSKKCRKVRKRDEGRRGKEKGIRVKRATTGKSLTPVSFFLFYSFFLLSSFFPSFLFNFLMQWLGKEKKGPPLRDGEGKKEAQRKQKRYWYSHCVVISFTSPSYLPFPFLLTPSETSLHSQHIQTFLTPPSSSSSSCRCELPLLPTLAPSFSETPNMCEPWTLHTLEGRVEGDGKGECGRRGGEQGDGGLGGWMKRELLVDIVKERERKERTLSRQKHQTKRAESPGGRPLTSSPWAKGKAGVLLVVWSLVLRNKITVLMN